MQPPAAGGEPARASLARHLTVAVVLALLFLAAFGGIAQDLVHQGRLGQLDRTVDETLHRHAQTTPAGKSFFNGVSELGNNRTMGVLAGLLGLLLLPAGRRLLALVLLVGLFLNRPIDSALKDHFQLERPPPAHAHAFPPSWGFPSGHALGSVVGYGLMAYVVLVFGCRRRWSRAAVVAVLSTVVLLIGFSRLYLHAHYLSQVLGGFAAGAAWLAVWIAVLEVVRRPLGAGPPPRASGGWFTDAFALAGTAALVAWLAVGVITGWLGRPVTLRWWADALVGVAGGILGLLASVIYARGRR